MKRAVAAACTAFVCGLLACVSVAVAQAPDADRARKEREIVWYTAMSTQDADTMRRAFQEKFPGLTVTVLRQPGEKIRTRILSEMQANRFGWDVVSFNMLDMDALRQQGLLATYRSRETQSSFPSGTVDPEGHWAAIYQRQYVLGYNTNLVPPARAPKDWTDLLDPSWKGRLALDESDVEWYGSMLEAMGRERGDDFMRHLAQQTPTFRRGHTLLMNLLVAGEYPAAVVFASEVEQAKRSGAPVAWVRTTVPVVSSASLIAISAKAPHPNAARLFVDFMLSQEGQTAILRRGRTPVRSDVATEANPTPLNLFYVNPKLAAEFTATERAYEQTFKR